jgi:para-nitrobenzyl esterase
MLMAMPEADGLFHRAIAQSPAQPRALEPDVARHLLDRYLAHLSARGIAPAAVYDAPVPELVAAVSDLKKETDWGVIGHPIHPILDGEVVRRQPLDAIGEGRAAAIPLLVGWNRDELVLNFGPDVPRLPADELVEQLARPFPEPEVAARMAKAYGAEALAGLDPPPPPSWTFLNGDRMVRIGAGRLLEAQAQHQPHTYAYALAWDPPSGRGSLHCLEIPLVFGTAGRSAWGRLIGEGPTVDAMSERLQAAWAAFARTGDPNVPGLPGWPRYEPSRRATMLLADAPRVADDVWPRQREAWDGLD